jgi:hypothetical protein
VLEVIVQTIFLALYLSVRIIGLWNFGSKTNGEKSNTNNLLVFLLACQVLTAKSILGVGLIYYYYRILFIFLPISPKLGPMMIRLRCMVIKLSDYLSFDILIILDHG